MINSQSMIRLSDAKRKVLSLPLMKSQIFCQPYFVVPDSMSKHLAELNSGYHYKPLESTKIHTSSSKIHGFPKLQPNPYPSSTPTPLPKNLTQETIFQHLINLNHTFLALEFLDFSWSLSIKTTSTNPKGK